MPPEKEDTHAELLRLTRENNELLKQNHEYLRKMHRNEMVSIGLRVLWYAILIGLPFAVYFYVLQPYVDAFGTSYENFRQGIVEVPGLKGLENLLPPITRQ